MTDPAEGEVAPLLVDVDGLPQRLEVPTTKGQRRLSWLNLVLGTYWLLLVLLGDEFEVAWSVLGVLYLLLGATGLLTPRAHLRLEPEGVSRVGLVGRGRLTPWSAVAEVRPPDAFHPSSHLRGPGGRFAETTDLPGLPADDARELQRRLEAVRSSSERRGGGSA